MYDFSVDYNSIKKSDILNIHNYLMTKNLISKNMCSKKKQDINDKNLI